MTMPLPEVVGEFGIVADPEVRFSEKGNCWVKMRCVAKDRKRGQNGEWEDGDPLFIDILVFGKYAEHLAESAMKGDTVLVKGRLTPNKWTDKEGNERNDVRVLADEIAVSLRWGPARTAAAVASMQGGGGVAAAAEALGATEVEQTEAPF